MAAGLIVLAGRMPAQDRNGRATTGRIRVYENQTTTPVTVYSSSALSVALSQPIESDSAGQFPLIWIDSANTPVTVAYEDDSGQTATYDGLTASTAAAAALVNAYAGAVSFTFSTTTTDADPGAGTIRFNNATIASVTSLYIDNTSTGGTSVTGWLDSFDDANSTTNRGVLAVRSTTDQSVFALFTVTGAVTDGTGYRKVPVAYLSGVLPANGADLVLGFSPSGPASAATVTVGTTTAVASTASPTVTNSGTSSAAVLDFAIPRGAPGGVLYTFSTTTTDSDPGAGKLRLNNATPASATAIYIDNADANGNTVTGWLDTFDDSTNTVKGTVTLRQMSNGLVMTFNVTGSVVDGTGYRKLTVTHTTGTTLFTNDAEIAVTFQRAGNIGVGITEQSTGFYLTGGTVTPHTLTVDATTSISTLTGNAGSAISDIAAAFVYIAELTGTAAGMSAGVADAFEDELGVDGAASTNEVYDATNDLYYNSRTTYSTTQPAQTTNSAPSGYNTSASSIQGSGQDAYYAFDQNNSTVWQSQDGAGLPQWIKRQFPSARRATAYTIRVINTTNYRPTAWTVEGSNDNSAWTTLDTRTGQSLGSSDATYSIATPGAYLYYRMTVTAGSGNGLQIAIYELSFTFDGSTIYDAMSLRSVAFTAGTAPTIGRMTVAADLNGGAINTDLIAKVSRDGGTTWTNVTLTAGRTLADGTTVYEGQASLTSQPTGTSMKWRLDTTATYDVTASSVVFQWS